jgi:putative flippase GtrA
MRARLLSRRGGAMLVRNTVVSIGVFAIGLAVLWALVDRAGAPTIPSAAVSFLVSNTLHYGLGRSWIYRGTERALVSGYAYFLVNSGVGLVVTLLLFAGFVAVGINYLVARTLTSLFSGLLQFVLNAVFNFRAL